MTVQETALAGSVPSLTATAEYLRATYAVAARTLADQVAAGRVDSADAWQGEAAEAYRSRLSALVATVDGLSEQAESLATAVDLLAAGLASAHELLAQARDAATAGGLTVTGTTVHGPGAAPPAVAALPAGASAAARRDHDAAVAAVHAYDTRAAAWAQVQQLATTGYETWDETLDGFAATWSAHRANLVGVSTELVGGAAGGASIASQRYALTSRLALLNDSLDTVTWSLSEAVDPLTGRLVGTRSWFYRTLDLVPEHQAAIKATTAALDDLRPSIGVARGTLALGVAATGFGIYDDLQNGESVAQATASNVGGMVAGGAVGGAAAAGVGALASIAGVAATGAAVGSAVPVVGTVVGAVVGAGVGVIASGAIDEWFENGGDTTLWSALEAGWDELAATGQAAGDLVSGAWEMVFPSGGAST